MYTTFWLVNLNSTDHRKYLSTNKRIKDNIKIDLREKVWRVWIGFVWLRIWVLAVTDCCDHGDELPSSTQGGNLMTD
jgi:hypothetical protein